MFARFAAWVTSSALRLRGLERRRLEVLGWQVTVHRGGDPLGEPWILLHGLGATAATFLPLVEHLKSGADLALPELSELGGTTGPTAALPLPDAVEVVARLIRDLWPERRVTIAGISLGGWIAVRLALAHPRLVDRLLLVVPGGYRDQDWDRISAMVNIESYRDTEAMYRALFVAPPLYLRLARPLFFLAYRSAAVQEVVTTVEESQAFDDRDLARLDRPVGLVWGERDSLFRLEAGQAMARALPTARLEVVADAGHAVQWEKTAEFLAAVDRLRARFPPSPGGRPPAPPVLP